MSTCPSVGPVVAALQSVVPHLVEIHWWCLVQLAPLQFCSPATCRCLNGCMTTSPTNQPSSQPSHPVLFKLFQTIQSTSKMSCLEARIRRCTRIVWQERRTGGETIALAHWSMWDSTGEDMNARLTLPQPAQPLKHSNLVIRLWHNCHARFCDMFAIIPSIFLYM